MGILKDCINNKHVSSIPVWFMRQAGRYLPEFREVRSKNENFINLCLNPQISKEITLQPLKRFRIDAAIIFSDILLIPYALGQKVEFKKNFGPKLEKLNSDKILETPDNEIVEKLNPIYKLIKMTSEDERLINKDLIGFVGATWTLLVYMINQESPKDLKKNIYSHPNSVELINKIVNTQKIHIKHQIENGASIIQIFDSWAGLIDEDKYEDYIYKPTIELVKYTKKLGADVICFPRNIKSYNEYCKIVNPSAISIDSNVDPKKIAERINIPIQGGMDPKCLLLDKNEMLKKAQRYLEVFKNHEYIFNLGHGVMPETDPENVKILVDFVKDFK